MLLQNKVAVVYGAGGAIGAAVGAGFAREGATVFLTARHASDLDPVAKDIASAGGGVHVAAVNALDEPAIKTHLESVVDAAGRVDISFNAVGIGNSGILGIPL